MRILIIGSGTWAHPIWRGLLQATARMKLEGEEVLHLCWDHPPNEIDKAITEFDPEIAICIGGGTATGMMQKHFSGAMSRLKCPRAFWFNDLRTHHFGERLRGLVDHVFLCFKTGGWQVLYVDHGRWEKSSFAKAWYMPQGADEWDVDAFETQPFKRDAIFIGNTSHNRYHAGRRCIVDMTRAEVINHGRKDLRAQVEADMFNLYRTSRFCISTSPRIPGYTSVRAYRILAVGGLMLLHEFPGASDMFRHGQHAIFFNTPGNAARWVRKGWEDPQRMEEIRREGWKLQRDRHTMYARLKNIMANMLGLDTEFWGYL